MLKYHICSPATAVFTIFRKNNLKGKNKLFEINYNTKTGNIINFEWQLKKKTHRKNKPAIFMFLSGNLLLIEYYTNGKIHKENGPACIKYKTNAEIDSIEYRLNNNLYSKEDFFNSPEYQAYLKKEVIDIFD